MSVTTNARLYDKDGVPIDASHPVHIELAAGLSADIGATTDAAIIDPTDEASVIALLKGMLSVSLSSEYDTINVNRMSKGGIAPDLGLTAITTTTTSNQIDCRDFNTISVEMSCSGMSGSWTASVRGCAISGGTFGACYAPKDDGTFVAQATPAISADGNTTYYFRGIPNYVKILATLATTGTLTCKVTPMNL